MLDEKAKLSKGSGAKLKGLTLETQPGQPVAETGILKINLLQSEARATGGNKQRTRAFLLADGSKMSGNTVEGRK